MIEVVQRVETRRVSRRFDYTIGGVGAVVGLVGALLVIRDWSVTDLNYSLAIPLIVVLACLPMRIGRRNGTFEIGFDICVLVYLGFVVEPAVALTVWAAAQLLGQLVLRKRRAAMVFNVGIGVTAGALALLVLTSTKGASLDRRELLAVGLSAAVYFAVDYAATALSIALEERSTLVSQLSQPDAVPALAAYLAIAALGYLGVVVERQLGPWSLSLVAIPVATILVAVRARAGGNEQARRLRVLFDASASIQKMTDEASVMAAAVDAARELLQDHAARLSTRAPGPAEVGAKIDGRTGMWIVGSALDRVGTAGDDDSKGLLAVASVTDTALARLTLGAEVAQLAWHDPLTGLANRALFLDRLTRAAATHSRRSGHLAVLFCDLDGFKRVNDVSGHVAGDELLIEVARRITGTVREADTVARLGGDEFAVLLEDLNEPAEAQHACDRILATVRDTICAGGSEVSVTVTIGMAVAVAGQSADVLLRHADMAMYHAKAQGKDRWEAYRSDLGEERLRRVTLVESLRRAIEARELTLAYQTVHDLRSGDIYGIEALARWRSGGIDVSPGLFIPAAEESGLIVPLGQLVLELVTEETPSLRMAIGRRVAMGFNVSARQLQSEHFPRQILQARARMGDVDLVLEMTEREFANNDPRTLAAMTELADHDVRFAMDDFGIGFSSIGYLHRLPVRILKIDKSFIAHIEDDARACSLVRSMVVMGNALGLDVVAEGVERVGQVEHLKRHAEATIGQGYLYGRPVPRLEMVELLSRQPALGEVEPHPIDVGQALLAEDHVLTSMLGGSPIVAPSVRR